ncbi:O-methyltransferase [Anaerococcus vaginalis]|uniref:tRNA 5-hydroxyuridine methyltransferase n=2 Tax=Anaerococcus vaginalis TaxID=33037 RepID=C7HU23_9FIRM|nr:O-methyltransferase [Anaerococcus vaginalis]EEU12803.1 O-methyltransferase [Anaerococcus vaginalis ATCC 51170]MDU2375646.1 O-methyltransferase [Anaerococcus vaginalis]MDU5252994.1 O-methyltransferase [Anaerococcus vaginalis]MDU5373117.1 O-methyltransferase [Anaerococcus vaginalis]MDU6782452.1 O-methyltransferase [Anaerococcus vaginalis]
MNINYNHIVDYLNNIYIDEDFIELRNYGIENNIPIMKLETKEFLKTLISISKPKNILEIGTAIGYSSLLFSKYSNANITTIEKSKDISEIAKANFSKYNKKINLINMDAKKALNNFNQGFDFVFIDANKSQYEYYFNESLKLLNENGLIVCDNILFRGEITNDDLINRRHITMVKNLRKFLSHITNLDDYVTSIIPIGDGISLTTRRVDER